jgi:E3 ubiquitin-protein ligase HECTD1
MDVGAEMLRRMPPRVRVSDFDENGILNFLATNGGTTAYVNPHTSGRVIVTASSLHRDSVAQGFIGRSPPTTYSGYNVTNNGAGSWVAIQLPLPVILTMYTLRHGRPQPGYELRNWNFEGSNDGVAWVVLRTHANDASLAALAHSTASWDVDSGGRAYSRYRIHSTGTDSSGYHFLAMGGLELYGTVEGGVRFAPGQVRV